MENSVKKGNSRKIALIGIMSAFTFIANYFSIPIGDVARVHFGNVMCVLSGFILGGTGGGIAAGLGGFFYDLTNPVYAKEAFITFILKFALGFVAGKISQMNAKNKTVLNAVAAVAGSLTYWVLYLFKNFINEYYIIKNPMETVITKLVLKGSTSLINAVIAVVFSLILYPVFLKAIKMAGVKIAKE